MSAPHGFSSSSAEDLVIVAIPYKISDLVRYVAVYVQYIVLYTYAYTYICVYNQVQKHVCSLYLFYVKGHCFFPI